MHIAIEGMDGVGKTTAARKLAELIEFKLIEKPLHYLFNDDGSFKNYIEYRDYINAQIDNDALRAWYYGLGNIFLYHRFKGENIITDRHLASNYFWCGSHETKRIFECMVELIGKPDFTFLLHATIDVGLERLKRRDPNDPDIKKAQFHAHCRDKMESFLRMYEMPYAAIDTTDLDPEQVIEAMITSLPTDLKDRIFEEKKA